MVWLPLSCTPTTRYQVLTVAAGPFTEIAVDVIAESVVRTVNFSTPASFNAAWCRLAGTVASTARPTPRSWRASLTQCEEGDDGTDDEEQRVGVDQSEVPDGVEAPRV